MAIGVVDVLSGMLRELRFSGILCCSGHFSGSWGLTGPGAGAPLFHFVREGSLSLAHEDDVFGLSAGDLVILPHGHSHRIYEGAGEHMLSIREFLQQPDEEGLHTIALGDGPSAARSVCGIFLIDKLLMLPFWSSLPPVIHVRQRELATKSWLPGVLDSLFEEIETQPSGASLMAKKMSEMVFLTALRCFLNRSDTSEKGWFFALREPRLSRALHTIHVSYRESWTLASLAKEVGMSRSTFASFFKTHIGESPMNYLTMTRMRHAIRMLQEGSWALKEIASLVGFRSYVGFHNAFKRTYRCTPGAFRTDGTVVLVGDAMSRSGSVVSVVSV